MFQQDLGDPPGDGQVIAIRSQAVTLAITSLRTGSAVLIDQPGHKDRTLAVTAIETLSEASLTSLRATSMSPLTLVMTLPRAEAMGLPTDGEVWSAFLKSESTYVQIKALADPIARDPQALLDPGPTGHGEPVIKAALDLAKLAGLMPMLLVASVGESWANQVPLTPDTVTQFVKHSAHWLSEVASTRLPLADAEDAEIVAFRSWDGGPESLAIVIGKPDVSQPVLTRIHSSCFTGDLIGSLRCDCGDQLRGAISAMAAHGSGVLIYLPQEGRGIGLVNKLRAYALQDTGLDTIDANTQLGFESEERRYIAAGEILHRLKITRILLLTNNPGKRAALHEIGVEVVERVPLVVSANRHSEAYLHTKVVRDGHEL
jgi:GTP cyclohydrolase II